LDEWKHEEKNAYYDSELVAKVVESLRELVSNSLPVYLDRSDFDTIQKAADDVEGVRSILEICLRSNFAGTESFRLYSETYYGTKQLIEDYVDEGVLFSSSSSLS
jgi:hypothetical protein